MGYKRYCKDFEKIENYEAAKKDDFKGWACHHRLETHTPDRKRREVDISREELKSLNKYYNRPASELIFMLQSDHIKLHRKGKHLSEATRKRLSEMRKGKQVGKKLSEEHKNKISKTMKGHQVSVETKRKMSEAAKKRWAKIKEN